MAVIPERNVAVALDEGFVEAARLDRRRQAAINLGASPNRCQGCRAEVDYDREVAWSDAFSMFLCLDCYEERAA